MQAATSETVSEDQQTVSSDSTKSDTGSETQTDQVSSTPGTEIGNEEIPEITENESASSDITSNLVQENSFTSLSASQESRLCGWLTKIGTVGFVKTNRLYWFVFADENCKLYYYRGPNDLLPQGEIDISKASFYYDVNKDKLQHGILEIRSEGKTHYIDAQDRHKMLYWLQELQSKRREYSKKRTSLSTERMQLTIKKRQHMSGLLGATADNSEVKLKSVYPSVPTLELPEVEHTTETKAVKPSSFKTDILNVVTSIKSQLQSPTDKLSPPRSPSNIEDWSIIDPDQELDPVSPQSTSGSSSGSTSSMTGGKSQPKFLNTLKKMRIGKRTSSEENIKVPVTGSCGRCKHLYAESVLMKGDLKSTEEELQAHREIVKLLQKELDMRSSIDKTVEDCKGKSEEDILEKMKEKDRHIVELECCLSLVQEEKSMAVQQKRQLESEYESVKEHSNVLQEMLMAKNEIIEKLTSQIYELENTAKSEQVSSPTTSTGHHGEGSSQQTTVGAAIVPPQINTDAHFLSAKDLASLKDACTAYEIQNKILTKEIQELNELRQYDMAREKMMLMNAAQIEGDFLQTKSKYLYLLKELEKPQLGGEEEESKKQDVINQLLQDAMDTEKTQRDSSRHQLYLSSLSTQEYDRYGFQKWVYDDDVDLILARAGQLQDESERLCNRLKEAEEATSHQVKWENFMVGQKGKYLTRSPELKTLIRTGIPHEYREQIWRGCINLYVAEVKLKLGPNYYQDLVKNSRISRSSKQIELDLLRTLPNNIHFESLDSDGIKKLRRVLLAYSNHNQDIGYCQGLNRLVAIALLFLTEEESFWCLVAIVDHIMPPDYYTKTLAAAQADQRVLKDIIQEKLPKLAGHFEAHEVDVSLFTFNWFLTVFVDNVPPETFLKVWDSFLYEGSKVMFRFAISFLKHVEDEILCHKSSLAINRYMRVIGDKLTNSRRIAQIAFHDLNPFPMRTISTRRSHHLQQVRNELAELDIIRQRYTAQDAAEDRTEDFD